MEQYCWTHWSLDLEHWSAQNPGQVGLAALHYVRGWACHFDSAAEISRRSCKLLASVIASLANKSYLNFN